MSGPRVAVVGVTGAVGQEFLALFDQRQTPIGELVPLASARSAGQSISFRGESLEIREATPEAFDGIDVAYFSAGGSISKALAPQAAKRGAVVIDNSSAFRMDPAVPLIVPEVNPHHLSADRLDGGGIIANPNCSTIILLVAISPIHRRFGVRRVVVSTYQALSGAGLPGLKAFDDEAAAGVRGEAASATYFPEPCFGNVFLHESTMDPTTGRTVEEQKMIDETRKIWGQPYTAGDDPVGAPPFGAALREGVEPVRIAPTCVRVGVRRAHSESVNLELAEPATVEDIRETLAAAPGVGLIDDRASQKFPTPLDADGGDAVLVGRIRGDDSLPAEGGRFSGIELFCSGDQIRKGAALNAVQIGELVEQIRAAHV